MDEVETTYTTIRISTARRRELERLRLKLTVERDEVVMIQDALDIAIAAVKQVNSAAVKVLLDIYGAGDIKKYLTQDSPDIRYRGIYPQEQAQQIISGYDLLLVPSRHEGWRPA